jgi:hypothetical protein
MLPLLDTATLNRTALYHFVFHIKIYRQERGASVLPCLGARKRRLKDILTDVFDESLLRDNPTSGLSHYYHE